jgi:hypothetical protein
MRREDNSSWSHFFDDRAANDQILRRVLDCLPVPLALHAPDGVGGYRFIAINRAFERLWRVPADTLIDTSLADSGVIPLTRRWNKLYDDLGEDNGTGETRTSTDRVPRSDTPASVLVVSSTAFRAGPGLYGVTLAVEDHPETAPHR